MNRQRLIVFADYGLDDAAATVTVLQSAERFSHIDIVPVGGNVPVAMAYENCLTLLSHFRRLCGMITVVDARHIPQPGEYLASIHGKDGMGDVLTRLPGELACETLGYQQWLEGTSGSEMLLSLGPMTLVRPLMERHSSYEPVIMGGCVHTPPNYRGYEFNQSLDRESFSFCTRGKHAAVTLDTCRVEPLDMRGFDLSGEDLHSVLLRADLNLSLRRG